MIRRRFSFLFKRRHRCYTLPCQKVRIANSQLPPIIKSPIDILRTVLSDLFLILGIVSAISFLDYFHSSAEIVSDVTYYSVYYDDVGIKRDFLNYGLYEPLAIAHRLHPYYAIMLPNSPSFGPDNPVDSSLLRLRSLWGTDSISKLVKFDFRSLVGSFREGLPATVMNSAFWENMFFDSLSHSIDSTTLYEALMIVVAHRQVNTSMMVYNKGLQDAKAIRVYLEPPFLVSPRMLMNSARVKFLAISPDYPTDRFQSDGDRVVIDIPYLRAGQGHNFMIVTSMQNLSSNNIYVTYETEKTINLSRFIVMLGIVAIAYWGPFPYIRYKHRLPSPGARLT